MKSPAEMVGAAALGGAVLGFLVGSVFGTDPLLRAKARELATTTDALIESCYAVQAENALLVRMGVSDLTKADALGLFESPPVPPAGMSGAQQ